MSSSAPRCRQLLISSFCISPTRHFSSLRSHDSSLALPDAFLTHSILILTCTCFPAASYCATSWLSGAGPIVLVPFHSFHCSLLHTPTIHYIIDYRFNSMISQHVTPSLYFLHLQLNSIYYHRRYAWLCQLSLL